MLLVIDTALENCAVGLWSDGGFVAEETDPIGRGHAERFFPMLDNVLATAAVGYKAITNIAVTIGPGSFTGVRVGVAAARGLALSIDRPCVGVSTLEAIGYANAGKADLTVVALDAKRSEFYAQAFAKDGRAIAPPTLYENEAPLPDQWKTASFIGTATGPFALTQTIKAPELEAIAALGSELSFDQSPPNPLYLRGADAKPQTRNLIARA